MVDPAAVSSWAWAQQIAPEEKLLLLYLVTGGEVEPRLDDAAIATGLGHYATKHAAESLHRRGLIDDNLRPIGRTE